MGSRGLMSVTLNYWYKQLTNVITSKENSIIKMIKMIAYGNVFENK